MRRGAGNGEGGFGFGCITGKSIGIEEIGRIGPGPTGAP
jgi:hypothetical protein